MHFAPNPFIHSRPLEPSEFMMRKQELRHIFSWMVTGQPAALTGQPHIGKTSLLKYIFDTNTRTNIVGTRFDQDLFSFLDARTLQGVDTQAGFWEKALAPLAECLQAGRLIHLQPLEATYKTAKENKFGTYVLEQLFARLSATHSRLILLLDEFDDFLVHPALNNAEFYGGLCSLASRSRGLVLVIAARRDLRQLNEQTQATHLHSSPYFNIFVELRLGPFSWKAMSDLLDRAGNRFDRHDRKYVVEVSGRHPYLAQAAAAKLWEVSEDRRTGYVRYREAGKLLHHQNQTQQHFADTWHVWSNQTRKTITAVALTQIPRLLPGHTSRDSDLIRDLADYSSEWDTLEDIGLLARDAEGNWSITQGAFLWWLADEMSRNVRNDAEAKAWLQAQDIEPLLTRPQQQQMSKSALRVRAEIDRGAMTLIEACAQAFA